MLLKQICIRSLMKGRNWDCDLEDETTVESHIIHADSVRKVGPRNLDWNMRTLA